MIERILRSYTFAGTIYRLDLLVGIILVSIAVWVGIVILGALGIAEPSFYKQSQLGKVTQGLVVTIFVVPLMIARLKDLKWSPGWVVVYVVAAVLSLRNILVLEAEIGEFSFSYPLKILSMIMVPVVFFFLGTLLLRRSQTEGAT